MQEAFQTAKALLFTSIIGPVVGLLFTVGLLYFMFGVARYIWGATEPGERAKGQQHMLWGVIGMAIMLSAFGIATFVFNSVTSIGGSEGIDGQDIPTPQILEQQNFGG